MTETMPSSITDLLTEQVNCLEKLVALLDRELQLISVREPELLLNVVNEKSELLDTIQGLDQQIETSLARRESPDFTDEEQALVDDANKLLATCKHCTAINEKAVEQGQLKLAHLRQLIVELRARESMTYNKSGRPTGGTLGKGISA